MNQQIRKLAERTFFDEETTNMSSDKMYTFSDTKMQKFAELIVQDCVMFIDKGAEKFSDGEWLRTSVKDIGAMIKEHFGVE